MTKIQKHLKRRLMSNEKIIFEFQLDIQEEVNELIEDIKTRLDEIIKNAYSKGLSNEPNTHTYKMSQALKEGLNDLHNNPNQQPTQ